LNFRVWATGQVFDPRLLDPKVLFQEVAEVPKVGSSSGVSGINT
jgi:hypothetical protein